MPDSISVDAAKRMDLFTSDNTEVYIDQSNRLTIQDMLDTHKKWPFATVRNVHLQSGRQSVWLRFVLKTSQEQAIRLLEISPSIIDYADMFIVRDGKVYQHQRSGISIPSQERPFNYSHPLFRIHLSQDQDTIVYMRIESQMLSLKKLELWTPSYFLQNAMLWQITMAAVLGMYAFMIIASLWFERAIQHGVYRSFALYVGSCLVLNLMSTGWWYQLTSIAASAVLATALMWTIPTGLMFFFKFASSADIHPKLTRWMTRFLLIYGVFMTCVFLIFQDDTSYLAGIDNSVSLCIAPFAIYILWKPVLRGTIEVKYVFSLLFFLLVLSVLLSTLNMLKFVDDTVIVDQMPFIISTILFVYIFYLLARQYKKLKEERDSAVLELLTATQFSEQELSRQVEVQTHDLRKAKVEIEHILNSERQAHQDRNNFIAMVSHEFRTPLAVIAATAQNLLRMLKNEAEVEKVKKIKLSVNRLTTLMNGYLSQDRLNLLNQPVEKRWVDVNQLLNDAQQMSQLLSPGHPVTCRCLVSDAYIWADTEMLKLVLNTLIENVLKYTPQGTQISIIFNKTLLNWQIDVIDDGPGIAEADKERIFEKYYRASTSSNEAGTGMGLSLARHLMHMQGGDLIMQEYQQKGCKFSIIINNTDKYDTK